MIANSKNQDLVFHSVAVGLLAVKIFEKNYARLWNSVLEQQVQEYNHEFYKPETFKKVLFNAGLYHDVGKLDANFQNYITKSIKKEAKNKDKTDVDTDNFFDVQIENEKDIDLEVYPLHHELSWAFLRLQDTNFKEDMYPHGLFLYSIYWHHAKLFRKESLSNTQKILNAKNLDLDKLNDSFQIFNNKAIELLNTIKSEQSVAITTYLNNGSLKEKKLIKVVETPNFQNMLFSNGLDEEICLLRNALNHLCRSILISADRCISKLSKQELENLFDTDDISTSISFDYLESSILDSKEYDLTVAVDVMKEQFLAKSNNTLESQERNKAQEITVNELAQKNQVCVLQGPAGVGKTKIMLEWLAKINNKKKTYIIAPKTNIVNELYNEIKDNYLVNTDIEKITGAEKYRCQDGKNEEIVNEDYFKSTINITTIDQLMSLMMSHNNIDVYLDVLNSNIIFDEFHEFVDTPALLMLFIQTIILKRMSGNGKALLVSATPNPFLLHKLKLCIQKDRSDMVRIDTFNTTDYTIQPILFDDCEKTIEVSNAMFDMQEIGTICIFNTASKAQISSIKAMKMGEINTLTYHSKFFSKDRQYIFKKILKEFGKEKTRNAVLRTGPILQASIDVSTDHMLTEISSIDNIYQRMGRLVRWKESSKGKYEIAIPNNFELKNTSIVRNLNKNGQYPVVKEFVNFLNNNIFNQQSIKLKSLYNLYFEFFNQSCVVDAYEENWSFLKKAADKIFQKEFEPIKMYGDKKANNKNKVAAKKSMRGSSIFGFAMTLECDDNTESIAEKNKNMLKIDDVFSIERKFSFEEQEETAILNELKNQIENNYIKKPYFKEIRDIYFTKVKAKKKAEKNVTRIPNLRIIDMARYEETPIIFSYDGNTALSDAEKRYNIIYKGLKLGLMNYETFKNSK